MEEGLYFSFIGSSHSGKSTLLQYIAKNYDIETKEVSARKFLDVDKGSYDKQMNDDLETKINFYYLQETFKNILEAKEGKNIITTRCIIDSLAYSYSLKAAEFLIPQMKEVVSYIKDKVILLYTPCDFPMSQEEDILRGMNEKIRQATDQEYRNIINYLDIPHYVINGSIQERQEKIDNIMKKYNIIKK